MVPGYLPTMAGATAHFFHDVLSETLQVMDSAGAAYLVIGGVATTAYLGEPLDDEDDIDLLIRTDDAERLLEVFERAGYATHRRDEEWVYKVGKPDVTVDLIFRSAEHIELDEDHLSHSRTISHEDIDLRVPAPEDLVILKAAFDAEDRQGRWYSALKLIRSCSIDWDYLSRRGATLMPDRILSLLLYAKDEGIDVPEAALSELLPSVTPSEP